ncbi:MAG: hypothetical protein NTX93_06925 [Bacteroidia bacterium]|nr:hypothetical protein [Bacteroidia bacterium]
MVASVTLKVSGQVQKFVSSEQVIVNVDFSQVHGYDKIYLTFDFDNKIITLSNSTKGSKFTFKMVSTYKENGTMVGTTLNILVTSTNAPAVKRFYFSPEDLPGLIWMENKDGKTTTFGGLTRQ